MIGDYLVLGELGAGLSGRVKLAKHSRQGFLCAIKVVKKSQFVKTPDFRSKIYREIALMRLLDHPHILKLIEVCESQNHLYIVLEYAQHGELFQFLISRRHLDVDLAMNFFRQIIYGLEYLHSLSICHRDLKPENILLTEANELKIADFGFARWMKANMADTSCGSPHYAAPEVVRGIPYDGRGADIWSCGVILFALLAGKLPFYDPVIRTLLNKVKSGQFVMPDFLPEIQNLISSMLTVDPNSRITLEQIKQHAAFRIGYAEVDYILPTPLPVVVISDPVDFDSIPPPVLKVLQQIGFTNEEELREDFQTPGHSMAKVFYHILITGNSRDRVPWDSLEQLKVDQQPDEWSDTFKNGIRSELLRSCGDIPLRLEELMTKMQKMVTDLHFQWFHPNDHTILARRSDQTIDLVINVKHQTMEFLSVDLEFRNATQGAIELVSGRVSALLTLST